MKPKIKKTFSDRSARAPAVAGHPCFDCGLIFARREEYVDHVERYHQSLALNGRKDQFRCHECDQTFAGDDEKGFKEHLRIHDLTKIFGALRRFEMVRKRVPPLVVRPPPMADVITSSTTCTKNDAPIWVPEEKPAPVASELPPPLKNKGGRPRSKSAVNTNTLMGKALEITAKRASQASAAPTPTDPARKRRRVSNETAIQATTSSPQSTVTALSSDLQVPATIPASLQVVSSETAPVSTEPKTTPAASFVPPPSPATMPTLPLQPPTVSNVQKVMPALNSACPNCNQNLGKPWHLVDHMIQMHEAQLLRLHRTLKKPDGTSGMVVMSQMFNDRQCPFCQLTYADMQTSLLHVVRTHRSRLFECPDNGECVLTCELMCAIGPDAAPKKFTISVKVKRKTNE